MAQFQPTIAQIAETIEQLPFEDQQQLLERLKSLVNHPQKKEGSETDQYGGIDLSEYVHFVHRRLRLTEGQIEPEQLELLKEFMGAFEASEDFDPKHIYHPLDYAKKNP